MYIGGSDVPIILGISKFKTKYELALEKAGIVVSEFVGNEYTEYGNAMEPKIRKFLEEANKTKYKQTRYVKGIFRGHTDGENETHILEIKTHGKNLDLQTYEVQIQMYLYLAKKNKAILATYERPIDFDTEFNPFNLQVLEIEKDDNKINHILKECEKFTQAVEKLKLDPLLTEEELFIVDDITVLSNELAKLDEDLLKFKEIEERYKSVKEQLCQAMIENDIKSWETNQGNKITLVISQDKEIVENVIDVEKLHQDYSKVVEDYNNAVSKCSSEVTKIKKGAKPYVKITLRKKMIK